MKKVIVTSGDRDGIGLEVSVKGLAKISTKKRPPTLLCAHVDSKISVRPVSWRNLFSQWTVAEVYGGKLSESIKTLDQMGRNDLLIHYDGIKHPSTEASWFNESVRAALRSQSISIVTGPVSKKRFLELGHGDMGHTGILRRQSQKQIFQGYVGEHFSLVLATDHVALKDVEDSLTPQTLKKAYAACLQLQSYLGRTAKKPVLVLGLNPHAGEGGLIGKFEKRLKRLPAGFLGPISPDAAFQNKHLISTPCVLAMYHDQGLIPFKMLHGQDSGFQISLGLPFIRTSVDHGTAKDIFGKNKANAGSMIEALNAVM